MLAPNKPAPKFAVAIVILVTCVVGAGAVYQQVASDQAVDGLPTLAAVDLPSIPLSHAPNRVAAIAPDAVPSAIVSSAFQTIATAPDPRPQPAPPPGPITDGSAHTAPVVLDRVTADDTVVAPSVPDAKPPVRKPKPARTTTMVQVYLTPGGQQVAVHRPVKSVGSMFEPWSGFENAPAEHTPRLSHRLGLARSGQFEPPFGGKIFSR